MKVTANSAFRAVHQCQILEFAEGDELVGDFAVYLIRSGADVSAADEEAEALVDELESSRAAGESPAVDALPEPKQRTEEPGTRVIREKQDPEPAEVEQPAAVGEDEEPAEQGDGDETEHQDEAADEAEASEEVSEFEQIDVAASNISTVLAWVGQDKDRAIAAFDAESDRGEAARSTLLDQLSKIAD
ncbi:MAG TPA: hypothetical protein VGL05_08020 [Kribbella sp.]